MKALTQQIDLSLQGMNKYKIKIMNRRFCNVGYSDFQSVMPSLLKTLSLDEVISSALNYYLLVNKPLLKTVLVGDDLS